ncbi:fibronectin type III domain-containing protein [Bowmanella denitrificans]|uniref:fibronectin type III domain-containing protein n=1 Tax=Bowmanella denitrificans TaxID=366582 RepID=UPI000C9A6867|nr:putative Ig domain-containing protein [Bowmanella denitrificans]
MSRLLMGANSLITIADSAELDLQVSTGWTVVLRGQVTPTGAQKTLFAVDEGAFLAKYMELQITAVGLLKGIIKSDNGTQRTWELQTPGVPAPSEDMVYFIGCSTSGIPTIGFCQPGNSVVKQGGSSGLDNISGGPWYIGANREIVGGQLDGDSVESFGIASTMLSDAQIQAIANGASMGSVFAGAVNRWYPCEEGSGTFVEDIGGEETERGTLSGTIAWDGEPTPIPVSLTATIPAQPAQIGTPYSLDLATYFAGNQTPFSYALTAGSLPSGLSLAGSVISGTPTAAGPYSGIVITSTDSAENTADTNAISFTVAAAAPPPTGTPVIDSVTPGTHTVSVDYSYAEADATGFDIRINGGAAIDVGVDDPAGITGLTPDTQYTVEVRAYNDVGDGAWSAPTQFTTQAAVATASLAFTRALVLNNGTPRANETGITVDVQDVTSGQLVLRTNGHTTNAQGIPASIASANLQAAVQYRVVALMSDGSECVFRETAQ